MARSQQGSVKIDGARMMEIRKRRGLSLVQTSERVGCSTYVVWAAESGKRLSPSSTNKLVSYFGEQILKGNSLRPAARSMGTKTVTEIESVKASFKPEVGPGPIQEVSGPKSLISRIESLERDSKVKDELLNLVTNQILGLMRLLDSVERLCGIEVPTRVETVPSTTTCGAVGRG